jgi:hypothetical protein
MAAVDEPGDVTDLRLAPTSPGVANQHAWKSWPPDAREPRLRHCEITITGLSPRQTYSFELQMNAKTVARAKTTTLPAEMPARDEKPFTVLLGSCFAHHEDNERNVGKTFSNLPHADRPDVKFLAGDQVYLDSPWYRYLFLHTEQELRDAFVEHYTMTWGQTDGFALLLNDGANFFSSDDHEYWNNAPNFVAFARNTWNEDGRYIWYKNARQLYEAFQTPRAVVRFDVSPVSFLIADTRINRDDTRTNFMRPEDLAAVDAWVQSLRGPGVLMVGQPVLQTATGRLKGNFTDWNLPDFAQYHDLATIVGTSQHALVILSGDVHYGRVAHSALRTSGSLIEIISSPMSLVDATVEGRWEPAPTLFPPVRPANAPASLASGEVNTLTSFNPTAGHFLTLEFTRRGPGAALSVRYWPMFSRGVRLPDFGKTVWERTLV